MEWESKCTMQERSQGFDPRGVLNRRNESHVSSRKVRSRHIGEIPRNRKRGYGSFLSYKRDNRKRGGEGEEIDSYS